MDLWDLKKGTKILLEEAAVAEIVEPTEDGQWVKVRYLKVPQRPALEKTFGLGPSHRATVEVLWPGGVRNRLDKVKKFESVVFPEIPCSYDGVWEDEDEFNDCVEDALDELVEAGIIEESKLSDFSKSMIDAFREVRSG